MLKISKMTDYGLRLLAILSKSERQLSAHSLAEHTGIPEPTVRKIMKQLSSRKLVESTRGASGGYSLAESTKTSDLAVIVEVFEGKIALTSCCDDDSICDHIADCDTADIWQTINRAFRQTLSGISLAGLAPSPPCQSGASNTSPNGDLVQLQTPAHQSTANLSSSAKPSPSGDGQ